MKRITIGRGRECDIRLEDTTDSVSRRQAIITVTLLGKMIIYDTSTNGTYVNGQKIERNNGVVIKRGDNINFAHITDLNWDMVKDPYKRIKTSILIILFGILICIGLFFIYAKYGSSTIPKQQLKDDLCLPLDTLGDGEDSLKLKTPVESPDNSPLMNSNPSLGTKGNKRRNNPISSETGAIQEEKIKISIEEFTSPKEPNSNGNIDDAINEQR